MNEGTGAGVRVGLMNLFNDQNKEANLLANQLLYLKTLNVSI